MFSMYVIGDRYIENSYYDFAKKEFDTQLTKYNFLPTLELAEEYIKEKLDLNCVVIKMTIFEVTRDGKWQYSLQPLPQYLLS